MILRLFKEVGSTAAVLAVIWVSWDHKWEVLVRNTGEIVSYNPGIRWSYAEKKAEKEAPCNTARIIRTHELWLTGRSC